MSINTFIGFLAAFALFLGSIFLSTDNYLIFVDLPSLVMVIGGTVTATFISYEFRYVMLALKGILSTFKIYKMGRGILNQEVGRIIRWGYLVQQKGLPALEAEAKAAGSDPFVRFALDMVVSGYSGEDVRTILANTIDTTFERDCVPAKILKAMAATAPAFGMLGTLIGLIIMLDNMGADPTQLGSGLAVALNTTLYGIVLARMVFLPAASKVQQRQEILRFRHELIAEGFALLADRRPPRYIQDRMNSFLDPAIRFDIDKQMKR